MKSVFESVKDLDGDARPPALDRLCADSAVRREVESLLEWDEGGDGAFLEDSPLSVLLRRDGPDPMLGQTLGAYRVAERIGQGGMGTVYRAVRADAAYEKAVAIKVISRGLSSDRVILQFKRERQAVASLDHHDIARLVDGGTTADGRPYFVMDYVEGVPLDVFCDRRHLSIDERLRLFRRVCAAVHYAHQRLIVHSDLKPDNILVTADGTPKLLDFGVAKLLDGAVDPVAGLEATRRMTPEYSSPEQMSGQPITTATDVYSLGVVLYVLLSGRRPYDLEGRDPRRIVCDTAALPPSEVCPPALVRRLAGDLDAIVLRAMEKRPDQRYGSIEQFSDDILRHLESLPVRARQHTVPYRLRRFVVRRRYGVAGGLVAAALVVLGVSGIAWQAQVARHERARAERRLNDVRRLADSFMFEIHDAIVNIPGTTSARALMVKRALEYLDSVATESGDEPSLQRELAAGYVKVADAQGHPTSANVGDSAGARASYEKAIAICNALLNRDPQDVETQRTLAMALRRQGDVVSWTGDVAAAIERAQASLAIYQRLAARSGATAEDRFQYAIARIKIADVLGNRNFPNAGRTAEALDVYRRTLPALQELAAADPRNDRVLRYLALIHERLGSMFEVTQDLDAALASYQESFRLRLALADRNPFHHDIQRDAAVAYEKVGNVLVARGEHEAALAEYRLALARFEQMLVGDPSNALAARSVAISLQKVGSALRELKRYDEALSVYQRAQQIHKTLAARDAANAQARKDLAEASASVSEMQRAIAARSAAAVAPHEVALTVRSPHLR